MPKTLIITPAYTNVDDRTEAAVAASGLPWLKLHRCSDLVKARSALITEALATDVERVLFLDSDVVPTAGALRWLSTCDSVTPEVAVWGRYVTREADRWALEPLDHAAAIAAQPGELFEIEWGGLGLACVDRDSLERVADTLLMVASKHGEDPWWPFCLPMQDGADYLYDDRSLCRRLRSTGTRLMCRADMIAAHAGGLITSPRVVPGR